MNLASLNNKLLTEFNNLNDNKVEVDPFFLN